MPLQDVGDQLSECLACPAAATKIKANLETKSHQKSFATISIICTWRPDRFETKIPTHERKNMHTKSKFQAVPLAECASSAFLQHCSAEWCSSQQSQAEFSSEKFLQQQVKIQQVLIQ